jgi:vitamin B12 transporter
MMKQTLTLSFAAAAALTLLPAAETELGEIVVTPSNTPQALEEVTSDVVVITADEIKARGYTSLAQALSAVSGISFTSNGGPGKSTSVYLRGMASKHTLVLIDGIRYNDPTSLNGAPFEHIMLDDIERIEIVKGAQSGIWGPDASAGVINIITKSAKKGTHASAHVEGGSFNTWRYGASVSHATERFDIRIAYDITDTDGFSAYAPYGTDIDNYEDDEYKNETLHIKAGWNIDENNRLALTYTRIDAEGDADPYDAASYSFNPNGDYAMETTDSFARIDFTHKDDFNELTLYAQRSDFSRDYPDDAYSDGFDGTVDEYGLRSKIPYREDDFVQVGIDYREFTHENKIDKSYDATGVFITNTNTFEGLIGGKTILTETLRYDDYSDFGSETTWKIGIKHIHSHIEGLTTSFNYGTAYNVPTLYNLYDPFSGNENLTPETVKSYDITLDYKGFSLTYFNNRIEDMIQYASKYDAQGNWIGGGYENVAGTSKIDGLEAAYQTQLFDDFLIAANYTRLFKAQDNQGKDLPRRAKDTFNLAVDYYGIENLHIGAQAQYVGERYDRADKQGEQTGTYTIFNLTADYRLSENFELYGKIENLGDKYYQTVYNYAASPRAYYVGLRGKF